ncbi:MAG: NAD(P)H-quinone oxidoreductase [Deltaproteobacteria bacterium]|nr:NAD(P)H-quinone oxidoreductase [Deltaproteobacteria bacterium]
MRAIVAKGVGGPSVLELRQLPEPIAGEGQTIVDIKAAALNRADLLQAAGKYPPPPGESEIFGLEAAGIDRETKRRVCCLLGSGGLAERVAVDRRLLLPLPDALDFTAGAAIPEVWLTAYLNLFVEGGLRSGETVLVHAAASGVGTAAVQLARRVGAKVIGTVRSAAKVEPVLALGAARCIDTSTTHANAATIGRVDLVLDVLGAGGLGENLDVLAPGGRLVVIGLLQGAKGEIDLREVLARRLRIIGSTLRSRSLADKVALTARFADDVWPAFASRELKPVVDSVLPMKEAAKGLEKLARNATVGKVVLTW